MTHRCTGCGSTESLTTIRAMNPRAISCCPERDMQPIDPNGAGFAWANFCKVVFYGRATWPSYSYWIVPGTITDPDRVQL